jgi:hypothetical protein
MRADLQSTINYILVLAPTPPLALARMQAVEYPYEHILLACQRMQLRGATCYVIPNGAVGKDEWSRGAEPQCLPFSHAIPTAAPYASLR